MSTLQPRPPYSPAELRSLYPPSLSLQYVQVLLRHGERTPVTPRFQSTGLPSHWPYCAAANHLKSAVLDPRTSQFSTLEWKRRLETFGESDAPVIATGSRGEVDGVCDMGMLTDKGRETAYALGERLRHLYVDQLGFLTPTIPNADSLYLRATPIPRALESLQQAFHGLYPAPTRGPDFPPPTIVTRSNADETLLPNDSMCRRFAVLSRAFAKRTAERWNETPEMAFLTRKLGKHMPDGYVAVDSHPRLSGIMDTMNATNAHGPETKLPAEFYEAKVKKTIETIGVEEWYSGYQESQEYRTLGIGGLMGDVVARMVSSAEQSAADGQYEVGQTASTPQAVRLGMSGCHDTTMAAVLSSLGAFDTHEWPPFTSHIAIELFRDKNSSGVPAREAPVAQISPQQQKEQKKHGWISSFLGSSPSSSQVAVVGVPPQSGVGRKRTVDLTEAERQKLQGYYVRLRYNDRPVTVPGCRSPGNHLDGDESFCTLTAFKAIVDKYTPIDWREQCRSDINATAFPAKPEPAGY